MALFELTLCVIAISVLTVCVLLQYPFVSVYVMAISVLTMCMLLQYLC